MLGLLVFSRKTLVYLAVVGLGLTSAQTCFANLPLKLKTCLTHMYEYLTTGESPQWIDDQVEVVWFPTRQHTKLRVGEDVFGNECPGNRCAVMSKAKLDSLSAPGLSGGIQFRAKVRVTPQELVSIQNYIKKGWYGWGLDCSHSACMTLNMNTGAWVPFPFGLSPMASAGFLAISRFVPGSRIIGVKVHWKPLRAADRIGLFMTIGEAEATFLVLTATGKVVIRGVVNLLDRDKRDRDNRDREKPGEENHP